MGMDYSAHMAYTVKEGFVREKAGPILFAVLDTVLKKYGIDLDQAIHAMTYDFYDYLTCDWSMADEDDRELTEEETRQAVLEVSDAIENIRTAFFTSTGLSLFPGYHEEREGSRYDDVVGAYWEVDRVVEYTEAAKQHLDHIRKSFYVTYG